MLELRNVSESLLALLSSTDDPSASSFGSYHSAYAPGFESDFKKFVSATMDEVRLFHAEQFAERVLRINYTKAWKYFRRAVLQREISGQMEYDRQRDHAAHTVHNYLLGWFIFCKSRIVQEAAEKQFIRFDEVDSLGTTWKFAQLWPITSLLHDVGYMFEGSLHVRDLAHQNVNLIRGAEYANEYFRHNFWNSNGIRTQQEIDRVLELTGISIPHFKSGSISEFTRSLRTLPKISRIKRQLEIKKASKKFAEDPEIDFREIEADCFRIWSSHYSSYRQTGMKSRVEALEKAEHIFMTQGIPKHGTRVVDHGLAGAMLLLQAATLWYEIHFAMPEMAPEDSIGRRVWNSFKTTPDRRNISVSSQWYWSGILSATAAVAMHNVAQLEWPGQSDPNPFKIGINEDVLCYLGILVDILEEWDRYTMKRDSIFTGERHLPVQAIDVRMGIDETGKIIIEYPTKVTASKVIAGLNSVLIDWEHIVEIRNAA